MTLYGQTHGMGLNVVCVLGGNKYARSHVESHGMMCTRQASRPQPKTDKASEMGFDPC